MIKVVELAFAIVTLGLGVSWILFPDVLLEPYTVVAGVGIAVCEIVRRRSSRSSGRGGRGGGGTIEGNRGVVVGGSGGKGGIGGPGGDGGSGFIRGDDGMIVGGDGGNAASPDGRGGRGARGPTEKIGGPTSTWPYGRGGSGANDPECDCRLGLLKSIRLEYLDAFPDEAPFVEAGVDPVPTNWINKRLEELGERWRVEMGAGGYTLPPLEKG